MTKLTFLPVLFCVSMLAACGGGGARTTNEISTVTRGQELLDLKKALDAGAMTASEYERQRRLVLERGN